MSSTRDACLSPAASMTVPDDLKEAADVHWLNSLDGEACLLVDSYRDLADGLALEEAVFMAQGLRAAPKYSRRPADRIRNSLAAAVRSRGRSAVPPRILQPGFVQRVCDGEPIACGDLLAFLKHLHGRGDASGSMIASAAPASAPAPLVWKETSSHNARLSQEGGKPTLSWCRRRTTGEGGNHAATAAAAVSDTNQPPPVFPPRLPLRLSPPFSAAGGEKPEPRCQSTCPMALEPGEARPAALNTLRGVASARRADNRRRQEDKAGVAEQRDTKLQQAAPTRETSSHRGGHVASAGFDTRKQDKAGVEEHDAKKQKQAAPTRETSSRGGRCVASAGVDTRRQDKVGRQQHDTKEQKKQKLAPKQQGETSSPGGRCCVASAGVGRQRKYKVGREEQHGTEEQKQKQQASNTKQEACIPGGRDVASAGVDRRPKHNAGLGQVDSKQEQVAPLKQEPFSSEERQVHNLLPVCQKRAATTATKAMAEKRTTSTAHGSSRRTSLAKHGEKGKCCCGTAERTSRVSGASGVTTYATPPLRCCGTEQTKRVAGAKNGMAADTKPVPRSARRSWSPRERCASAGRGGGPGASSSVPVSAAARAVPIINRAPARLASAMDAKPSSRSEGRSWRPSQRSESADRRRRPGAATSAAASAAAAVQPTKNRAPAGLASATDENQPTRSARVSWSPSLRCESTVPGGRRPGAGSLPSSSSSVPASAAAVPRSDRAPARLASAPPASSRAIRHLSEKPPLCSVRPLSGLGETAAVSRMVSAEMIRGARRRRLERRGILRWMDRLGIKVAWSLLTPEDLPCHERLSSGVLLCELAAAIDYAVSGGRGLPLSEMQSCPGRFVLRGTCGTPSNAARSRHNVRTALGAFRALGGVVGTWLRSDEAILEGDHGAIWGLLGGLHAYYGRLRPRRVRRQRQVQPAKREEEAEEE
ncbi:unnamed protein product, partial [Laminaria digitata]